MRPAEVLASLPAAQWSVEEATAERERVFGELHPVYPLLAPAQAAGRPADYATVWHGIQEPSLEPSPPLVQRMEPARSAGPRRWRPW